MTRSLQRRIAPVLDVRRIALVRALQLGDLLVAVPALRAIRAGYPTAEITFIGLPWAATFAARYPAYVDRFVAFPGWPGIDEAEHEAERAAQFVAQQRAYGYDLVVQLHGSGRTSNSFCLALGGRITAGYFDPAIGRPEGMALAAPYPDDGLEVLRVLGVAALLGCPTDGPHAAALEFPLTREDLAEADALLARLESASAWIGIHPGARAPSRRWPAGRFARLADRLVERLGAQIVLTGGPGEEETARAVADGMCAGRPLNLAGQTTLGGLAAVLARLDLFVGNDTGPAHLAEAVGTPTVRLFGPADPRRWGPLDRTRHRIVRRAVACSPCGYWECPIDHRCINRITVARAYDAVEAALRQQDEQDEQDSQPERQDGQKGAVAWSA